MPLCSAEVWNKGIPGSEIIQETTKKIRYIQEKMKKTQGIQKSYFECRRRPYEFDEEYHVLLKVTPKLRLKGEFKTEKLSPKYISPYQIASQVGKVAYR